MEQTSSDHLQILKMMKNDRKLRLYSITDDVAKDTNTMYVLWKGWLITDAMWEPSTCFENGGEEILQEYRHQLHL